MKKILILGLMCFMALFVNAQDREFVDLGLPSGTQWSTVNETRLHSYLAAVNIYGDRVPTREQWAELRKECKWKWTVNGYKVTGPNGNYIILTADGFCDLKGRERGVGEVGDYWSSTPYNADGAWGVHFNSGTVDLSDYKRCHARSVRLVQK